MGFLVTQISPIRIQVSINVLNFHLIDATYPNAMYVTPVGRMKPPVLAYIPVNPNRKVKKTKNKFHPNPKQSKKQIAPYGPGKNT